MVGSLGAALSSMVGNLTFDKKVYEELDQEIQKEMKDNFEQLEKSIEKLNNLVHEDTTAFSGVIEAFKLPRETEEEKAKRSEAIQEGYKVALGVPLRTAEECFKVLQLKKVFADHGNVNVITDVGIGALLAAAALESSIINITINLLSIKDQEYKEAKEKRADQLLKEGNKLKDSLLKTMYKRLG